MSSTTQIHAQKHEQNSLMAVYQNFVEKAVLRYDAGQAEAIKYLDEWAQSLESYDQDKILWWSKRKPIQKEGKQGIYLHGSVGRGKTMLMDLFYSRLNAVPKRRVHFHHFMQDVHQFLHKWRKSSESHERDPLQKFAKSLARQIQILCFDEFFVTDIADAMILGRLFTALLNEGIFIMVTTNWRPEELYEDGLQRELFLPFIDLITEKLDMYSLDGKTDYRFHRTKSQSVYFVPHHQDHQLALENIFLELTQGEPGECCELQVAHGRKLFVPKAHSGVAYFPFSQLCGSAFGSADYLAISKHFHTVILSRIPIFDDYTYRDQANRLMVLVDILYDHKIKLIASAMAKPDQLYQLDDSQAGFFKRTASRLMEMQSQSYQDLPVQH